MEDKIKELEKQIAELKEQLKKQKEPEYKRWRADDNAPYFFVNMFGEALEENDKDYEDDRFRYNSGNYFKTEEEAELYKKKLIAYQTVKDDAKGFEPDWKNGFQKKWNVYNDGEMKVAVAYEVKTGAGVIYFGTEDDAIESLKKHEAEWKLLFGVED